MSLLYLRGSSTALSPFRIEKLLKKAASLQLPQTQLYTEHWYFIDTNDHLNEDECEKLQSLLTAQCTGAPEVQHTQQIFLITPRIGTISAWASKATDIVHNCGLKQIERIERGMLVYLTGNLTVSEQQQWMNLLHDRMTESIFTDFKKVNELFSHPKAQTFTSIDILNGDKSQLQRANQKMGLALSENEIDYLVDNYQKLSRNPTDVELMMFAQANSEHCRHKIFNADFILNGEKQDKSLFAMIRDTHQVSPNGTIVAYKDNSSIIEGAVIERFYPDADRGQSYAFHEENTHIIMKVETHNHPTAIAPFAGAATGAGGEIRDEGATGRGSRPKAGLTGFTVSNLNIPDFVQPWERHYGKPDHISSALDIMLDGPIGGAAFNNEFGRPNLLGYFRTFEDQYANKMWGYHKPIMIAGGLGNIQAQQTHKNNIKAGSLLIQLGGPGMLIGLGGGAASSMDTGSNRADLDFNSVQRGNPEIERRAQEVIDRCWQLGENNPIMSIHDVGAGGLSNAFPELVHDGGCGAIFQLRDVPLEEHGLNPMQIWCNEAQERYVLAIEPKNLEIFRQICERERCPFQVVGTATDDGHLRVHDALFNNNPVDLSLNILLGKPPKTTCIDETVLSPSSLSTSFSVNGESIRESVYRLLRLPAVAAKNFLITIGDRTVGGMSHRDQMVGAYQTPVSNCAVTTMGFNTYRGEAMSMGEKPLLALFNAPASGRMAIGEAITNIAANDIGIAKINNIKLSANWMAACGIKGEDEKLYRTVEAVSQMCQHLGISIPVGKDSLSMKTVWQESQEQKSVISPLSLIISAFAPVQDVRKTITPELKSIENSVLLLIDLGLGKMRMGGSAFNQIYNQFNVDTPDIEAENLIAFYQVIQTLISQNKLLAYHDRSDGGVLVTLAEMAFASRIGLDIDLKHDVFKNKTPIEILFNEELGAVIQVKQDDIEEVQALCVKMGLQGAISSIATMNADGILRIIHEQNIIFNEKLVDLQQAWQETSYRMQWLRDNPECADSEFALLKDNQRSQLFVDVPFNVREDIAAPFIHTKIKPKVAILREQGVNGHLEMAAAFTRAGFEAIDVHMSDLLAKRMSLEDMQILATCGGFSYGDVLGAGSGWAKSVLFNSALRDEFAAFFSRADTLTLGVCNGCQMLSQLSEIIPNAHALPRFGRNISEQFEARLSMVTVPKSPSIILADMVGSRLPVVVSHGEGRADFSEHGNIDNVAIALQYIDGLGQVTQTYPLNPNGSPQGIAGVCSSDGRVTMMMPHPERIYRTVQMSWCPDDWRDSELSAWYRLFASARKALV